MARRTKFEPVETPNGWRLNVPAKYTETGKRERHFFDTKKKAAAAAKGFKKAAEEFGHRSQAIIPSLAEAATEAAAILAPWKISIVEAARMVADIREREAKSATLSAAGAGWLLACEGLRDRTKRNYRLTLERMEKSLGDRLMANIRAEEIQAAIAPAGTTPTTAAERIRNAKALWNWSAKKGWCDASTFAGVEMPKSTGGDSEIEILAPTEAARLLAVAEEHFPQTVASFALQLFGGIRAEEVVRMESRHVTAEGIDMPASVTKKGRRRHITPSATLSAWLAKHPFAPCPNWRATSAAVRRLCGWDVVSTILNDRIAAGTLAKLPDITLGRWPQNALRHSHASYSVAAGVPLESLLFEFGHAGTPALLRQHYVGRASKKQALEFFSIVPKGAARPKKFQVVEGAAVPEEAGRKYFGEIKEGVMP